MSSVTIVDPAEAALAAQAKLEAGGLDCELVTAPAKVAGEGKAIHHATTISIKCNKPVSDLIMIPPAPYQKKAYWTWPTDGAPRKVFTYDHVKLTGNKFYLTGNEGGEEKSTWVTVELDKTEVQETKAEMPIQADTKVVDKPPVQIGDASCTLTVDYFTNSGSSSRGVDFYVQCNHVVTEGTLKIGTLELTMPGNVEADTKTHLGGYNANQKSIAGKVAWFEGKAGDRALKSNEVQLEGVTEVKEPEVLEESGEASCSLKPEYFGAADSRGVSLSVKCNQVVSDGKFGVGKSTWQLSGDISANVQTALPFSVVWDQTGVKNEVAWFEGTFQGKAVKSEKITLDGR